MGLAGVGGMGLGGPLGLAGNAAMLGPGNAALLQGGLGMGMGMANHNMLLLQAGAAGGLGLMGAAGLRPPMGLNQAAINTQIQLQNLQNLQRSMQVQALANAGHPGAQLLQAQAAAACCVSPKQRPRPLQLRRQRLAAGWPQWPRLAATLYKTQPSGASVKLCLSHVPSQCSPCTPPWAAIAGQASPCGLASWQPSSTPRLPAWARPRA